jgi:rhamnopyranosyl-N-acetylglucosaminyl-diphospho-decaprenol beta-1,3/1,4-galactofuranosyltransferase
MPAGKPVFVVIVTFRRPVVLEACLQSLANQSLMEMDRVHVVVNSDDIQTLDTISSFRSAFTATLTYEVLNNEGPAGGFYMGIKKFIEDSRAEYVWLMDDDIIVGEGCLNELLINSGKSHYLYPKVIIGNNDEVRSFGWWGVLLSRDVVEKAGLPLKELFYWAEDSEYLQYRISWQQGLKPLRVENARVQHLHNRSLKRASWYYYYTSRNTLFYRIHRIGLTRYGIKVLLGIFPYLLYMIFKKEDNKWEKFKLLLLGLFHGLAGKIGKRIDPNQYS